MISKVYSATVVGLDCELVEVETDISASLSNFLIAKIAANPAVPNPIITTFINNLEP